MNYKRVAMRLSVVSCFFALGGCLNHGAENVWTQLAQQHGNPSVTLWYSGGMPRPSAPPLREAHPQKVVRVMLFPDGFVLCETADGSKHEQQVPPVQIEALAHDLLTEDVSTYGTQFPVDGSAYVLHVRADRTAEAAWSASWIDCDFTSDDKRVLLARRWQRRVTELACPIGRR